MKKVITKALFVNHLNETIGLSKRECQIFFETFIDIIMQGLKNKKDVKIVNFGVFKLKQKNERVGRNPKTKVEVMISKRNVVKFKSSEFLLNLINPIQSNLDEKP